jgi:hypothetical protein
MTERYHVRVPEHLKVNAPAKMASTLSLIGQDSHSSTSTENYARTQSLSHTFEFPLHRLFLSLLSFTACRRLSRSVSRLKSNIKPWSLTLIAYECTCLYHNIPTRLASSCSLLHQHVLLVSIPRSCSYQPTSSHSHAHDMPHIHS